LIVFLVLILVVCLGFWWLSPGVVAPFPAPGGISEKVFVMINGVRQGMFIRGKNRLNPVLLFLHGGPAMPEFAISLGYPTELEDDFVVCWWEQRGSGISFAGGPATEAQLVDDGMSVTDYLRARFGQEKIALLAHSAGTCFGIQLAARAPERFHAYVGVGQITQQMESERLAYAYMIEHGDPGTVAKLRVIPLLALMTMPAEQPNWRVR
jgi:pimeloyl-ACP methyl ester carboxylesterase